MGITYDMIFLYLINQLACIMISQKKLPPHLMIEDVKLGVKGYQSGLHFL